MDWITNCKFVLLAYFNRYQINSSVIDSGIDSLEFHIYIAMADAKKTKTDNICCDDYIVDYDINGF